MSQPFKDAIGLCKTIMRNGYDAYVVNTRLQQQTLGALGGEKELDICTEAPAEELVKYFPPFKATPEDDTIGTLREGGVTFFFYPADVLDSVHPEECIAHLTPRMLKVLEGKGEIPLSSVCPWVPRAKDPFEDFAEFTEGELRFKGNPDQVLKKDLAVAIRAMRFAANFNLTIGPNAWMAIVRNAKRVLEYVPTAEFMDEWRKVEPENMHLFLRLLFESQLLHGYIPELAALSRVKQIRNPETGEIEDVLTHTCDVMRRYPEELPFDWYGTVACMFHDVGKLYTAEWYDGRWNFLQHHHVGAKITRKILHRLSFPHEDIDLICNLVRNHMRFHFMLTDRGIRRFKAVDEYPRIIEMVRADIKARDGQYREFNHNLKMLDRADIPEEALEPLLNGNEIMQATGLKPSPAVGMIRDALLHAQIAGDVHDIEQAKLWVVEYKKREKIH